MVKHFRKTTIIHVIQMFVPTHKSKEKDRQISAEYSLDVLFNPIF